MEQIKILNFADFSKKYIGLVNDFEYGVDLLNDTNQQVTIPNLPKNINLSDLLLVAGQVFKVSKIVGDLVTFNSFLDYFNEDLFVTLEDNLYDLLNNNYRTDNDIYKRLTWLGLSTDLQTQPIKFEDPLATATTTPTNEYYNIKKLLVNTIISNKLNVAVSIDFEANKVNLIMEPISGTQDIRLDNYLIGKPKLPLAKITKNALEIKQRLTDSEGNITKINYEKYVLCKDNTVGLVAQVNTDTPELRILPAKYGSFQESVASGEEKSLQQIAEEQLFDTNEYFTEFTINNNSDFNTKFNPKIGDLIRIYYADYQGLTRVTAIKNKLGQTIYTCGFTRQDFVYSLRQKGVL